MICAQTTALTPQSHLQSFSLLCFLTRWVCLSSFLLNLNVFRCQKTERKGYISGSVCACFFFFAVIHRTTIVNDVREVFRESLIPLKLIGIRMQTDSGTRKCLEKQLQIQCGELPLVLHIGLTIWPKSLIWKMFSVNYSDKGTRKKIHTQWGNKSFISHSFCKLSRLRKMRKVYVHHMYALTVRDRMLKYTKINNKQFLYDFYIIYLYNGAVKSI